MERVYGVFGWIRLFWSVFDFCEIVLDSFGLCESVQVV